ncbi:hypothetical protein [Methylobacterium nonmethylotrophicum]|uniref:Uncharacterized protein n=1 Tax=Methylobacterium nonmethylotrophicum TaxID=1141884 RepID=A0A4Z0NWE2_9HYPH|nr:hypothetical protein [Methylobacterium nonmethylotrophicum]TGE02248.1 hypothetical protein EU555_00225 [Methylobacterium nonmethylotrophicum]
MVIQKPPAHLLRPDPLARRAQELRATAASGAALARTGGHYLRGLVCWFFALIWGFAALAAGLFGDLGTLIGVGAMAAGIGWMGRRSFARARDARGA